MLCATKHSHAFWGAVIGCRLSGVYRDKFLKVNAQQPNFQEKFCFQSLLTL